MIHKPSTGSNRMGHRLRILAGILGLALLTTLLFFDENYDGFREFIVIYIWGVAIVATQWLGNSYIYRVLDKKYSWQDHLVKRAVFQSLAIIAYSATAYMVVMVIMYKLVVGSLPENPVSWGLRSSYLAILISFTVSLVFVAVAFFTNWRKSQLEAERFKAEMLMYKYETLQNQINPHFLFNSFNVLSDLVYEDQKKAVDFISQLSQLFRYVLDSRDKELVPVREELEFMSAYTYLLQSRFEEKLSFQNEFEAGEHEMLVPMTLQLLIENCVKHNEISSKQPLHIQILRNGDYIKVENTLQPVSVGGDSKKTGLSNIRQQYKFFTDKEIVITQKDNTFSVEVPLIKSDPR
jgi:two-component system LytT family sensor kinase